MTVGVVDIERSPEELLALPEGSNVELVRGEFVEKPMSVLSAYVEARVLKSLSIFADDHKLGFVLPASNGIRCFPEDPNKVRKPDAAFFRRERFLSKHFKEGFTSIPPDLAVEVISTHDEASEIHEKIEEYLAAGIPLVWVIDPEIRIVLIHRKDGTVTKLHQNDQLSGEEILPGFTCNVADLFPRFE